MKNFTNKQCKLDGAVWDVACVYIEMNESVQLRLKSGISGVKSKALKWNLRDHMSCLLLRYQEMNCD